MAIPDLPSPRFARTTICLSMRLFLASPVFILASVVGGQGKRNAVTFALLYRLQGKRQSRRDAGLLGFQHLWHQWRWPIGLSRSNGSPRLNFRLDVALCQ